MLNQNQKDEILEQIKVKCQEKEVELLYVVIAGSHAYGCAVEGSDIDARFVFLDTFRAYLGFGNGHETIQVKEQDITGFEFKKFVKLAMANNPNVLELLFTDPEFVLYVNPLFQSILDYREKFLSKQVINTYGSYAKGQLEKAKTCTKEAVEILEWYENQLTKIGLDISNLSVKQEIRDKIVQVEAGTNPHESPTIGKLIDDYLLFKKQRWPYNDLGNKRRTHVKLYGFDTKNMSHCVRLLETCYEILIGEGLKVKRPNSIYLLNIKNGCVKLEFLERDVEQLIEDINNLKLNSNLQEKPDPKVIEDMVINVMEDYLGMYGGIFE